MVKGVNLYINLACLWTNLKNLSGGLNLSRGLNMVPLKIVSNVSRFKPALNLNRVLVDFGGFKPRLKFFKFHLWMSDCLFVCLHPINVKTAE